MARRAFCAACGREVWLGRDGGCQFGHPASQLSGIHEADPAKASQGTAAAAAPGPRPAPPRPLPSAVPAAAVAAPAPAPAAWGNSPEDLPAAAGSFDYVALGGDVSIGDTDCLVQRACARLLDNLASGFVSGLVVFPMAAGQLNAQMAAIRSGHTPSISATPYLVSFVLSLLYFVAVPLLWKGRTLGKAVLGLAVTDLQGNPPSLGKLIVREIAMIVDGLFYGIVGLVLISKNPRGQRIGDSLASTVVVRTR